MITADPGTQFEATLELGPSMTGLVGSLNVGVANPVERIFSTPFTTSGITEFPAGSGSYGVELTAPLGPGLYSVIWSTDPSGTPSPTNTWLDSVTVIIQDPTFPGGWSWSEWGWIGPDDSGQFDISTGSPGSNPIPVASDVRAASKLDWCEYGYESDTGPGGLQELVDRSESSFWRITGQTLNQIDAKDAPLVRRVIQGLTEQMAMQSSPETLDTQSDWDLIQSFTAGPYSEQRRSPQEMFAGRMLNPVPWISDALWSLLSYERYGHYISFFTGVNVPAWQGDDVFWEDGLVLGRMWGPSPGFWWGA